VSGFEAGDVPAFKRVQLEGRVFWRVCASDIRCPHYDLSLSVYTVCSSLQQIKLPNSNLHPSGKYCCFYQ